MSRETQPTIRLEVIVPHIALPMRYEDTKEMSGSSQQMEQVYLLPLPSPVKRRSKSTDEQKVYGVVQEGNPPSTTQERRFHLFRFESVPTGQLFLLHILRSSLGKLRKAPGLAKEAQPPQHITDEFAFLFEYKDAATNKPDTPDSVLLPGITRVEMVLDAEGKLDSYSIDGVES